MTPDRRAAARIRALRERAGWSVPDLASRIPGGMTPERLLNLELGRTTLRLDDVWLIAAGLGVSPLVLVLTHPADDELEVGGETVETSVALAWEAGADAPVGLGGTPADTHAAQNVAEAFGVDMLPASRERWLTLVDARTFATSARRILDDETFAGFARQVEQAVEAVAGWAADTAVGWSAWVTHYRPFDEGGVSDHHR